MTEHDLKERLHNTGDWTRVQIAISAVWLLISLVAYFSELGFHSSNHQLQDLWNSLTPSFMSMYEEIERPGTMLGPNLYHPELPGSPLPEYGRGFSFFGFFFFVGFPVISVWLAGLAIQRVRAGFKATQVGYFVLHLTGWQRLWVVLVCLTLAATCYAVVAEFPTTLRIYTEIGAQYREDFLDFDRRIDAVCPPSSATGIASLDEQICSKNPAGASLLWQRAQLRLTVSRDAQALVDRMWFDGMIVVFKWFFIWLLGSVITYLAGRWIAKGFRAA